MKTAEKSQGQGLRQAGRLQQLQKVGVTKEGARASRARKVFVRTVHFLLRVVGLLEQNDTGMTGMESQFSHCCFQNTQQKQPEGWEGLHLIQSFRFGSSQQREPGGGCSSVHSKRVQETELGMLGFYWPSAFPLLERNAPHSEWFLPISYPLWELTGTSRDVPHQSPGDSRSRHVDNQWPSQGGNRLKVTKSHFLIPECGVEQHAAFSTFLPFVRVSKMVWAQTGCSGANSPSPNTSRLRGPLGRQCNFSNQSITE